LSPGGFALEYNRLQPAEAYLEPPRESAEAALGDQLKSYFDAIVAGPVPDRLLKLADALDQAFDRGELNGCKRRPAPRPS
jgi:hypothetical protein